MRSPLTTLCLLLLAAQAPAEASISEAGPQAGTTAAALHRPAILSPRAAHAVMLGAAKAGVRIVAVGERGIILTSDDGGGQWRQANVPTSVTLTAVRFTDAVRGVAVGHAGVVLVTADGGTHWNLALDGQRMATLAMDSARRRNDAAAMQEAQRLTDEGADKPLLDLCLLGNGRVLVVGAYGLAFSTDDGGVTWTSWMDRLDNPKGLHLNTVRQRGDSILIAGERGLALLSTDGGQHFQRLPVPYSGSFFTAELTSDTAIVLAGLRGNIWHSGDAGHTWRQIDNPVPASITASGNRSNGTVVFASQAGVLLSMDAQAAALRPLPAEPLASLTGILELDSGTLLALTMQGLMPVHPQPGIGARP